MQARSLFHTHAFHDYHPLRRTSIFTPGSRFLHSGKNPNNAALSSDDKVFYHLFAPRTSSEARKGDILLSLHECQLFGMYLISDSAALSDADLCTFCMKKRIMIHHPIIRSFVFWFIHAEADSQQTLFKGQVCVFPRPFVAASQRITAAEYGILQLPDRTV